MSVNLGHLLNFGVPLQGSGPFQHNDTASWLQPPIVGSTADTAFGETTN
jgi:hypothetical protein